MFKYNDLYIFFLSLNGSLSSLKAMIYIQITFDIKSPSNHKCNFPNAQVIAPCLALIPYKLQPSLKKKKKKKKKKKNKKPRWCLQFRYSKGLHLHLSQWLKMKFKPSCNID